MGKEAETDEVKMSSVELDNTIVLSSSTELIFTSVLDALRGLAGRGRSPFEPRNQDGDNWGQKPLK